MNPKQFDQLIQATQSKGLTGQSAYAQWTRLQELPDLTAEQKADLKRVALVFKPPEPGLPKITA